MSQTHRQSIIETCASTAIGFGVAYVASYTVLPLFGHHVTHGQNFWITAIFTAISLLRGYFVRRLFNRLHRPKHMPGGPVGEIDYDAMPKSVRGMREDCEMDAVAAKALIPNMCHGLIREIDTQGGSAVAKLALPPEWIGSTRRDMEYTGWQWLGQEWTPRAPNVYMVEFRYVGRGENETAL